MNSSTALSNICRTCSVQTENETYTPLFVGSNSCKALHGSALVELIAFDLKIGEGDGLPQEICSRCLDNFTFIGQFREQCKDAQEVLEAMFEPNSTNDSDIIDSDSIALIEPSMKLKEGHTVSSKIEEVNVVVQNYVGEDECHYSNDARQKTAEDGRKKNILERDSSNMNDNISDSDSISSRQKVPTEESGARDASSDVIKKAINEKQETRAKISCKYCEKVCKSARGFLLHKEKCDAYNEVICRICKAEFENKEQLEGHIQKLHPNGGLPMCPVCSKTFVNFSKRDDHIRKIHIDAQFSCFVCDRKFKSKQYLMHHMNRHHSGAPICKICNKKFESVGKLCYHWTHEHTENMKYKCKYCEKPIASQFLVREHERSHTGERPFLCCQCGAGFRYQNKFLEHMQTHEKQHSVGCDVCGLMFSTDRQLKYHKRKHITKKHTCEVCGDGFSYKLDLYTHKYNEHKVSKIMPKRKVDYPFKCPQCSKGFLVLPSLSKHLKIHMDNERKHVCPHCGNGYKRSDHLNLHIKRMHLKVFEHKCEICGKEYLEKCQLKAHMIVHDSARPFTCTKCSASFKRQRALKDHMLKHEGKKEYACEICDMRFFNRTVVVLHTQRVHLDSQKKFMPELIRNELEDAKLHMEEEYESVQVFSEILKT